MRPVPSATDMLAHRLISPSVSATVDLRDECGAVTPKSGRASMRSLRCRRHLCHLDLTPRTLVQGFRVGPGVGLHWFSRGRRPEASDLRARGRRVESSCFPWCVLCACYM